MKILIDKNGWLHLDRAGKMKVQICPYATSHSTLVKNCGDWCPLFGEPEQFDTMECVPKAGRPLNAVRVKICRGMFSAYLEDFTDERGD